MAAVPEALAGIAERWPGWEFGLAWFTSVSGPDRHQFWAKLNGTRLVAFTPNGLEEQIRARGEAAPPH
jgi:hypothetical protein